MYVVRMVILLVIALSRKGTKVRGRTLNVMDVTRSVIWPETALVHFFLFQTEIIDFYHIGTFIS